MTPSSSAWRTLALTSVAVFVVSLDGTVLFVAFPAIRATFAQVSAAQLSWVLNAYTIVFGALLVPAGRIADRVGRKRTFLLGLALFSAASALCGLAPSAGALIAARALQAVGAELLLPSSLAVVLHAFPAARRASAVALWGAVGALAAAIGPSLGSLIIHSWAGGGSSTSTSRSASPPWSAATNCSASRATKRRVSCPICPASSCSSPAWR